MEVVLQVGVKALLKRKDGKYLLLKRSKEKYPEVVHRWDIVGGRINPGTSLIVNLKREIKEETGLLLRTKPTLIAAQDIIPSQKKHVVRLTYIANISGDVILDKKEHDAYIWITLQEMKKKKDIDKYFRQVLNTM